MGVADPGEYLETKWAFSLRTQTQRYAFALLAVVAATLLRYLLGAMFGFALPLVLFYPAILLVALLGGFRAGIVATLLSLASAILTSIAPLSTLAGTRPRLIAWLLLFSAFGLALSSLGELVRRRDTRLHEFERAVEGVEEGIIVLDRNYRYVIANRAYLDFRRMRREEIIGRSAAELMDAEIFATTVKPRLDECFQGKAIHFEKRLEYPGLGERDFSISYFPIGPSGGVDRVACVLRDITDRRRSVEALRASEDRYRDLVEHSEDLVCTHDLEGRLLSVNPAPARILGYTVEELLKIPMRELLIPEGREPFDAYLHRLRTTGEPENGLLCVLTKNGDVRTWEFHNTLRTDGVEKPIVRGMAHDITERRRAELALRESEEQLRARAREIETILDILPIPVVIAHDPECLQMTANSAGYAHLGVQPGTNVSPAAIGEGLGRRFLPDGQEICPDQYPMQRAVATRGQVLGVETKMVLADGTVKYELGNAAPLLDENGGVKGAVGAAVDITERILAEEALRASEERLWLAQQIAQLGTFDRDLRTGESHWTPQMEAMYGLQPGSFPRTVERFLELIHPDDRKRVSGLIEKSKESGEAQGEWRVVWPNGEVRWITGRWRVFKDSNGMPVRAIGIDYDITERKRSETALRASEERYRNFVAQSSEGIFREDLNPPISINLSEDELVQAVNHSQVAECNDALARMYGLSSAQELIGKQLADLFVPNDPRNLEFNRDYVRSGFRILDRETHETDVNGNAKVFLNSMIGIVVDGKLISTWGIQRDVTDQKKAEEALRASEAHFRILVEQASDGIGIADANGRWIDVNSAWAEIVGRTRDEILQQRLGDNLTDEEKPQVAVAMARLEKGEIRRSEFRVRHRDGSLVPVDVSAKRLPDGSLQVMARNITEQKRAEEELRSSAEALRRSEERFRIALQHSPVVVFNQDRNLRYTWIHNLTRLTMNEVLGKTDDEISGPDGARRLTELKRKVLETGVGAREEVAILHEGTSLVFDMTIEPIFDSERNIVGITGAAMDVAKLRELADSLQAARDKLLDEKRYLEGEIQAELGFEEIIGQSPALREVLKKARVVAPTDSTVLLLGETGTGKELVARAVHALSARREKNFIKLNCAAVPTGLLESELFGHEKGAFTGAVSQKVGRLELADKGTLFLDEVGELPLELQPKLLRVLQDREFERLGGIKTLRVDVRIISATNRDLKKDVAEKNFREDLFYRLNVFPIQLPPLRDRRADIPVLVRYFVQRHASRMGKQVDIVSNETMNTLQNWNWPGNVRELENMIERMVILSKGRVLAPPPVELDAELAYAPDNLTEMEREHIIRVLRETKGVLSGIDGAASRLGIKRTTLQSMLKRFGIEPQEYRQGAGAFGPE